jgi:ribonuclease HI
MEPEYTTLSGGGKLSTSNVTVENFTPLVKLSDALKMEQYKKFTPGNLNISFKFENGRVNIEPFDIVINGIKTNISGSNGFDQTIDYKMTSGIPLAIAGPQATGTISSLLDKANQAAGTNLSLGKEVKVNAIITGTVNDPKVNVTAGSITGDDKPVKEQLKGLFEDKKKELEDRARSEAERLKKEAEEKAKAEADRLKKEAEAKAKAEADRLKKEAEDKLKKEAEDKLKNLFGKPKK